MHRAFLYLAAISSCALALPILAYPISPVPLWQLVQEAEVIVIAKVTSAGPTAEAKPFVVAYEELLAKHEELADEEELLADEDLLDEETMAKFEDYIDEHSSHVAKLTVIETLKGQTVDTSRSPTTATWPARRRRSTKAARPCSRFSATKRVS
ncbi:MAG: hypothetical protein HC897_00540 [Thermoanaerobaculia bacterium]|nr:hypothetical protein [Thermoanaerobaculia bacterium]